MHPDESVPVKVVEYCSTVADVYPTFSWVGLGKEVELEQVPRTLEDFETITVSYGCRVTALQ